MKRDMDLLRRILFEIEEKDEGGVGRVNIDINNVKEAKLVEHLFILDDAGFIEGKNTTADSGRSYLVLRITSKGHDFLDSVRDDEIWEKTQNGAKRIGGLSIELLAALAKGFIKKKVKDHMGVDLDF